MLDSARKTMRRCFIDLRVEPRPEGRRGEASVSTTPLLLAATFSRELLSNAAGCRFDGFLMSGLLLLCSSEFLAVRSSTANMLVRARLIGWQCRNEHVSREDAILAFEKADIDSPSHFFFITAVHRIAEKSFDCQAQQGLEKHLRGNPRQVLVTGLQCF